MKVLAIDTSSAVVTVAVMDDQKLICEYSLNHKKTHSQKLMPTVKHVLEECELKVNDIDVFAVSIGPGSFTGLRIGVSTAKALAHAMEKPIVGVYTLDALASNVVNFSGIVCPILDAKRDQVYTAFYKWENNGLKIASEYMADSIDNVLGMLRDNSEQVLFLGDGVYQFRNTIVETLGERAKFAPKSLIMQKASMVAEIAMKKYNKGQIDDYLTLAPFYLRKSQAERLLAERTT